MSTSSGSGSESASKSGVSEPESIVTVFFALDFEAFEVAEAFAGVLRAALISDCREEMRTNSFKPCDVTKGQDNDVKMSFKASMDLIFKRSVQSRSEIAFGKYMQRGRFRCGATSRSSSHRSIS